MRVFILLFLTCPMFLVAQSVSNTYSAGDIPTSLPPFNPTCNGPVTTLTVSLPAGGPWVVTGIDIEYEMLAQSTGWKSHQRSQVYCQNTERIEASVYSGTGNENGVQEYSRMDVSVANSIYAGETELIFEMRAWRTSQGIGCNTTYNRVNNFTWMITVYYTMYVEGGSVGIGTSSPDSSAVLDLSAATKGMLPPRMNTGLRLAIEDPATGLVVYDTDVDKLYCFSGAAWVQIISDFTTILRDNDDDTKIQVEESADEDMIRFDVGGFERWIMKESRLEPKTAGGSVFIGEDAGSDGTGEYCVGIGFDALSNNTGFFNTAIGYNSLRENTEGVSNSAFGDSALETNTSGTANTAVGLSSLKDNISGDHNVGVGISSLINNVNGDNNTSVGSYSLFSNEAGSYNVALGYFSGNGSGSVDYNQCTFLGADSYTTQSRTNITMLGYGITSSECTGNNQVMIGNTGLSAIRSQVTSITSYSDARYKTNIIEDIKGLDFIKRLRPVSYHVRPTELHKIWGTPDSLYQRIDHSDVENTRFSGFLAQEVEQAAAASNYAFTGIDVPRNEKETYALRYTEFIVPLVKAVQELHAEVQELKKEIELLKKE